MKNLLYLLAIILIFSCTAKKTVTKSNIEQKSSIQNAISDTQASQTEAKKTVDDQSCIDSEDIIKTTNYDTSKPADPVTGKPPIISETTTTHKNKIKANVKTNLNLAKKAESTHKDNSKANADAKEKTKVVKKSNPTNWKLYIYAFLFVATALIVLYYRSKIKSIFSKIKVLFGLHS